MNRWAILKDDLGFLLRQSRDRLFPPHPRLDVEFPTDAAEQGRHRPQHPEWMSDDDPLGRAVLEWDSVIQLGQTTWGCVLIANSQLFEEGALDHPAIVAWSPDGAFDERPEALSKVVRDLHAAATAKQVPSPLHEIQELLRDGSDRPFGIRVPPRWSRGKSLFLGTVLVSRDHLPEGTLVRSLLPIRFAEPWQFPVIVPYQFWNPRLVRWWLGNEHAIPLRTRLVMIGTPDDPDARLPLDARRFLAARRPSPWVIFLVPTMGAFLVLLWILMGPVLGVPQVELLLALGVVQLCLPVVHLGETMLLWSRYQGVVDLYQDLWRPSGLPWTRFQLVPSSKGTVPPAYDACLQILGNWIVVSPLLRSNQIHVSVRTVSDLDEFGISRVGRFFAIPTNAAERSAVVQEIKALFRTFGEIEVDLDAERAATIN